MSRRARRRSRLPALRRARALSPPPGVVCEGPQGTQRTRSRSPLKIYAYRIKYHQVVDSWHFDLQDFSSSFDQVWQVSPTILEFDSAQSEETVVHKVDTLLHPSFRVCYQNGVFTVRVPAGALSAGPRQQRDPPPRQGCPLLRFARKAHLKP